MSGALAVLGVALGTASSAGAATGGAAVVPPDHAERMQKGLVIFRQSVAPVFKEQCLDCHGGKKTKADFDLSTREALLKGGSEGPAVVPFDVQQSRMLKLVRHEAEPAMPDEKPKLPEPVLKALEEWILMGAPYEQPLLEGKALVKDRSKITHEDRAWWAFQALSSPAVPPLANSPGRPGAGGNPIDAFLEWKRAQRKVGAAPPADRHALIRRLYLGVTGLPPSPAEVDAFVADVSPGAWSALVERQLASPAFGERWARHWLDVARFAESSGFEHDYDRPYAFHYRDFVIKAFNADMPFFEFLRWQIAGDELAPDDPLAMMATGFLGAGVFPTQITANEVERTRYDAMDDMLSTAGSAFLGLTIGCARCHDHKFDPIPTEDYYRMLATFTTTVRSYVDIVLVKVVHAQALLALHPRLDELKMRLASLEANLAGEVLPVFVAGGKWKESFLEPLSILEPKANSGATFRTLADGSVLAGGKTAKNEGYTFRCKAPPGRLRGLRLDVLQDPTAKDNALGRGPGGNFGLARVSLELRRPREKPVMLRFGAAAATRQKDAEGGSAAAALDEDPKTAWALDAQGLGRDQAAVFTLVESPELDGGEELVVRMEFSPAPGHGIARTRLSAFVGGEPSLGQEPLPGAVRTLLASNPGSGFSAGQKAELFEGWKTSQPEWRAAYNAVVTVEAAAPREGEPVLVCGEGFPPIVMHSQGAPFLPETHLLKRGDSNQKVRVIEPGYLQVLLKADTDPGRWRREVPSGAKFSGRRSAFAGWLSDVEHGAGALAARVAVNRLWQHHFGTGLVSTPNDFGKTGATPSHPELLDWLAGELLRNKGSLKSIHRLILTSEAYRQSGVAAATALELDPENVLLTRYPSRRLEGEIVRDAALHVSGLLDAKMYGPGTLDEGSLRRSVYFTVKRSRLIPSMVAFDAPEPLISQGSRPTTVVAPQALFQLNSPHARRWAAGLAAKVQRAAGQEASPERLVRAAYREALSREPNPSEQRVASAFLAGADAPADALVDFCQNLLSLNEFVYIP